MTDEGDRWFHIAQDRKRETQKRYERSKRRAERAARREHDLQRAFNPPSIEMQVTEWAKDEQGNLSRKVFAK